MSISFINEDNICGLSASLFLSLEMPPGRIPQLPSEMPDSVVIVRFLTTLRFKKKDGKQQMKGHLSRWVLGILKF